MRSEVVEYQGDGFVSHFTVSQATVLIGMARSRLRLDGERAIEPDDDRRLLRVYTYPDLCAAVTEADLTGPNGLNWPPDFETFLGLPDGLVSKLEEAVYRLNPHWLPGGGAPAADPKAPAAASTSDSKTG